MNPLPNLPKTILLATDGSEDAALAARAAVDLSERTGAELHVVHAWQTVPTAHFEDMVNTAFKEDAREVLDEQTKKIEDAGGTVTEAHLRKDSSAQAIVGLAAEIDAGLIVMGSRGLGRLKRLATGSVSEGVAHNAHLPVLMLRGGENAWPPKHIVVGEDGSEPARRVGELAAGIGRLTGAGMTLVRVYPELPEVYEEGRKMDPRTTDDELHRAEKELRERAGEIEDIFGSRPKISIAVGDAAENLVENAHGRKAENTLIAVGSRGLGPIERFRMGSVSTKVLRAAEGPVLVSPARS